MKTRLLFTILFCVSGLVCLAEEESSLPLPDPGNVTLTLEEYNRLVELASKTPKHAEIAPLPYSVKHADVNLQVVNDTVRGTVDLQGEVFRKGISKRRMTSGMTIRDAHQKCNQQSPANKRDDDAGRPPEWQGPPADSGKWHRVRAAARSR